MQGNPTRSVRCLRGLRISLALFVFALFATPAAAQDSITIEVEGFTFFAPDPSAIADPLVIGAPFSASYTIPLTGQGPPPVACPGGPPLDVIACYALDSASRMSLTITTPTDVYEFIGATPDDPGFPVQGGPVVVVVNDLFTGGGDTWSIVGMSNFDVFFSPTHRCNLFWSDGTAQRVENTSYFANDSIDGWNDAGLLICGEPTPTGAALIGIITSFTIASPVTANAGLDQDVECASHTGSAVVLDGSGSDAPADALYTWTEPVTGQEVTGVIADMQLPRGSFEVTLTVAIEGFGDSDTVNITVEDTLAPSVTADMVQSGEQGHMYEIVATASDVCDPTPTLEAKVGADVSDGATITIAKPDAEGVVRFMSSMVELDVTATDAAGNSATASASP